MVYYTETNLIAIVVGAALLFLGRKASSKNETSYIIMARMLRLLILLSVSDIAAYYFRGKSYIGVEVSNILYFIAMALGTYAWFLYILVKMGYTSDLKRTIILTGIPIVLLCIAIALNPLTNFFFSVDSENLYHRGAGVPVTWIVEWGYMLAALVINVHSAIREKRNYRRSEICGYLIFAVPIAIAAVCQMLFYGTTTTQVGYMIALLMAYLNKQQYQAQRDDLTGLNNRNAFLSFQDSIVNRVTPLDLTVFIMDADNFKSINDTYGHLKGDQALRDISETLKSAVGAHPHNRVLLYRYGGDEFLIVGTNITQEHGQHLLNLVEDGLAQTNERNRQAGEGYTLSVSVGQAQGSCVNLDDFALLMKRADENMYRIKSAKKKGSERRR